MEAMVPWCRSTRAWYVIMTGWNRENKGLQRRDVYGKFPMIVKFSVILTFTIHGTPIFSYPLQRIFGKEYWDEVKCCDTATRPNTSLQDNILSRNFPLRNLLQFPIFDCCQMESSRICDWRRLSSRDDTHIGHGLIASQYFDRQDQASPGVWPCHVKAFLESQNNDLSGNRNEIGQNIVDASMRRCAGQDPMRELHI